MCVCPMVRPARFARYPTARYPAAVKAAAPRLVGWLDAGDDDDDDDDEEQQWSSSCVFAASDTSKARRADQPTNHYLLGSHSA